MSNWLQAILARCRVTEEPLLDAILVEIVWRDANEAMGFDPDCFPLSRTDTPLKEVSNELPIL